MRRQAAIKLNSGKFSLETLGFVTADDNSVMFEFEVDSDRMTVIACDGYAAVRREGDSAYEFELAADTNNPFLIVTEHGRIPAGITGKKITLKKGPQPVCSSGFCWISAATRKKAFSRSKRRRRRKCKVS